MLDVQNLSVAFIRYSGLLARKRMICLSDASVRVERGEVVGVIGGSGAGKSLLAHAVLGLLPANAEQRGRLAFDGQELTPLRIAELRGRRIALVPQSISHLDPLARVRVQVAWAAERAGAANPGAAAQDALARFGLDGTALNAFPHELSGGMARRVLNAIATVGDPDLIVADEPTTGLDPKNVGAAMQHFRGLADGGKAVLVITHDIGAVLPVADRIDVLWEGRTVDSAPASAFAGRGEALASPYARALWQALPQNGFAAPASLAA